MMMIIGLMIIMGFSLYSYTTMTKDMHSLKKDLLKQVVDMSIEQQAKQDKSQSRYRSY